jgi:dTDP-glucose pyrophosphorylase
MFVGSDFVGVILAAGRGNRIFPLSEHYPKPLLPVCNKPLIVYQLEIMRALGIVEVFILIGYKGFRLTMALGDGSRFGVRITYVEQTEVLGIAHALGSMEGYIDRPFLLFLGDIFFIPNDLQNMLTLFGKQGHGAILAVKDEPDPIVIRKNYAIILADSGLVNRVFEKPRHATNRLKGVGIYVFDPTVFDAIRRTPRTAMRDEYEITDTIQVMIDQGLPVRVAHVITNDINITNPADLLECNLIEVKALPQQRLIGKNSEIHPGAELDNCVVGSNVQIRHPIALRNTVVFDNTLVDAETDFDGFLLTPEVAVSCRRALCGEHG